MFLLTGSCYRHSYSGDGKFTDAGWLAASERFVIDFGGIDLTVPNVRTYRMASLPRETFIVGLDIVGPAVELLYDTRPIHSRIRFLLVDERARTIIDEAAPLDQWVWSGGLHEAVSFVYRRGSSRDVPIGSGAVRIEFTGQKPDQGWGTYFKPRFNGSYVLRVEVQRGDAESAKYRAIVKAVGGGWK